MGHLARNAKTVGFLIDLLSFFVAFYVSITIMRSWRGFPPFAAVGTTYLETEILCLTSWSLALALFIEYPSRRVAGVIREVQTVLTCNVVGVAVFALSAFLFKVLDISRLFVCVYVTSVVVAMLMNRYVVRVLLYILRKSGWNTHTRILVGLSVSAKQYLAEVSADKRLGIQVVGYIADHAAPPEFQVVRGPTHASFELPWLGSYQDIDDLLKQHPPDGVVVALRVTDKHTEKVIQACEKQGISVELLLDSLAFQIASSTIHHGSTISSLCLSAVRHTPGTLFIKRLTDIVLSLVTCILLSPVFAIVAISIKLEDGGPILFKQQRVGLRNRPFWIYKFRSMCVEAEQLRHGLSHLNEMSGPVFKLANDPRVTRVGRVIRSFSLDELPQLFNVLIGNMSIVGPRPPLPIEVSKYVDEHRRRLSVKPGLTCLWQVSGRSDVDFNQWMDLDLAYIDNWSYLQDWKIMMRTIPAVLKRTGAR